MTKTRQNLFNTPKRRIAGLVGIVVVIFIIASVAGGPKKCSSSVALDQNLTGKQLVDNPDGYKCHQVQLVGKVFNTEKKDGKAAVQVWTDAEKSEGNVIVFYEGKVDLANDDYVQFTGVVGDAVNGKNAFGGQVNAPIVNATKIAKISRDIAIAPAIKTVSPKLTQDKSGLAITVKKIEYAKNETRVYMSVKNTGTKTANFYAFDLRLVQNGSQVKDKNVFEVTNDMPSDILPNTTEEGKLYYEKADPKKPLVISYEGTSTADYSTIEYSFEIKN
jgi:hypothetical protein